MSAIDSLRVRRSARHRSGRRPVPVAARRRETAHPLTDTVGAVGLVLAIQVLLVVLTLGYQVVLGGG